jgi:hypothetical protein
VLREIRAAPGEEGLFQLGMVEMAKETFKSYNVKKV